MASLIVWQSVVAVKYLAFIARADNHGEGEVLALLALLPEALRTTSRGRGGTDHHPGRCRSAVRRRRSPAPAISVLSAAEDLVRLPSLHVLVVPLTI